MSDGFLIKGAVYPPPSTNFNLVPTFYKDDVLQSNPVGTVTIDADGRWQYFFQASGHVPMLERNIAIVRRRRW